MTTSAWAAAGVLVTAIVAYGWLGVLPAGVSVQGIPKPNQQDTQAPAPDPRETARFLAVLAAMRQQAAANGRTHGTTGSGDATRDVGEIQRPTPGPSRSWPMAPGPERREWRPSWDGEGREDQSGRAPRSWARHDDAEPVNHRRLQPSGWGWQRASRNVLGGYDYSLGFGRSTSSRANVFGGESFADGTYSRRNVLGGATYELGFGRSITGAANVFGGQSYSSGITSRPNVFGGMDYYDGARLIGSTRGPR